MNEFEVIACIKNMLNGRTFSVKRTVHASDKYHALMDVIDRYEQLSYLVWHREVGCSVIEV